MDALASCWAVSVTVWTSVWVSVAVMVTIMVIIWVSVAVSLRVRVKVGASSSAALFAPQLATLFPCVDCLDLTQWRSRRRLGR